MTFSERALEYCQHVLSGKIPACKWTKAACQRHIDDIARAAGGEWEYSYDEREANRWCGFVERLPHVKGRWSTPKIKLEAWQVFFVCCVYGWKRADGTRRYRTAYLEVARKNAKTTLAAALALGMVAIDNEQGPEVYSAATTREQASISWQVAKRMVMQEPGLRDRLGLHPGAHAVTCESNAGLFQAKSSDAETLDGLNVHGAIIDELHAHKTRAVWDVLETATGSRTQPLILAITTAGSNRAGICYEQRTYVTQILNSTLHRHDGLGYKVDGNATEDDTYFGIIYTLDDADIENWQDEACWIKANPNYGVSVFRDDMQRLAKKAAQLASAQPNFLTKRLNVWVNADSAWMNMVAWQRAANRSMKIDDFAGWNCHLGFDLSSKVDITSIAIVFERNGQWRLFGRHYLPEDRVEESGNTGYRQWAEDGHLIETPGNTIDEAQIEADTRELIAKFKPVSMGFDPGHGWQFFQRLGSEGFTFAEVQPSVMNFSEPMKKFEELILNGSMQHDGNPAMDWMIGNVVCHRDNKDNIYPRKERDENKIDGPVSAIIALNRALVDVGQGDLVSFF